MPVITYDSQGHLTAVSTATIYPPTTAGTSGNVWVSDGSGQGAWSSRLTTAESDIDSLETSVSGKQDTLGTFTASGTVGSSTAIPVLGYDTDGHITSVSTASVHSTSLTAGSKGSTTAVPVITYDSQGHLTAVSTATIYPPPPTTAGTSGYVWTSDGSGQGVWAEPYATLEAYTDSPSSWTMASTYSSSVDSVLYAYGYLNDDLQWEVIHINGTSSATSNVWVTYTFPKAFGAIPFVTYSTHYSANHSDDCHSYLGTVTATTVGFSHYYCMSVTIYAIGFRTDSSLL